MAKPRFPKNTNDLSATIPTPNSLPPLSDNNLSENKFDGSAELTAAPPPFTATESKKSETRKPTRKPEIVKTEARANLVPINVDEEIRRLAYLLSERRGFEPGHEAEDWLAAEREIRQRYRQQSA
jgi:hypothetical protein